MKNSVLEQWMGEDPAESDKKTVLDSVETKGVLTILRRVNQKELERNSDIEETESSEVSPRHYEAKFNHSIDEWNLPVIEMEKAELFGFTWKVLSSEGFDKTFEFNTGAFWNFMDELYKHYNLKKNPFHNFNHGVNGRILIT